MIPTKGNKFRIYHLTRWNDCAQILTVSNSNVLLFHPLMASEKQPAQLSCIEGLGSQSWDVMERWLEPFRKFSAKTIYNHFQIQMVKTVETQAW